MQRITTIDWKRFSRLLVIVAVVAAFALGSFAFSVRRDLADPSSEELTVSQVYAKNMDSVVRVEVVPGPGGYAFSAGPGRDVVEPSGSGFVYGDGGLIVTNRHVVMGARAIRVRLPDGSVVRATFVAADTDTDIALIAVDAPARVLRGVHLGDSSGVQVGDGVVAIGSPFGLQSTVTAGIVSAVGRTIMSPDNSPVADGIQTDAAINHGSSGGPLLDMHGEVIGLVSQFISSSGGSNGVGLAVPSNTVGRVVARLLAGRAGDET